MSEAQKWDNDKPRLSLVDPDFLVGVSQVLGMGEDRYGPGNWKQGLTYSRVIDAAKRHIAEIERGEDIDPDSGESHASHAACNLMFLDYYRRHDRSELDDRHFKMPGVRRGEAKGGLRAKPSGQTRQDMQPVQESGAQPATQGEEDPVGTLQHRITAWANQVFPSRTPEGALHKMMVHELPELLNGGLDDPLEYADVLILLLDIASLRGIDAIAAAHEKMSVNERRQWAVDPRTGLMSHTREADE